MKTNTKKIMKALAVVLTLTTAATTDGFGQTKAVSEKAIASEGMGSLNIQDLGNLRFKLAFENPLRQKTKISLQDYDNNVIFTENTDSNAQYLRTFNLSNLVDGEYTFVVESGKEKITKDFVIKTQTFRGISLASNK